MAHPCTAIVPAQCKEIKIGNKRQPSHLIWTHLEYGSSPLSMHACMLQENAYTNIQKIIFDIDIHLPPISLSNSAISDHTHTVKWSQSSPREAKANAKPSPLTSHPLLHGPWHQCTMHISSISISMSPCAFKLSSSSSSSSSCMCGCGHGAFFALHCIAMHALFAAAAAAAVTSLALSISFFLCFFVSFSVYKYRGLSFPPSPFPLLLPSFPPPPPSRALISRCSLSPTSFTWACSPLPPYTESLLCISLSQWEAHKNLSAHISLSLPFSS